jgi:hypothetical protein
MDTAHAEIVKLQEGPTTAASLSSADKLLADLRGWMTEWEILSDRMLTAKYRLEHVDECLASFHKTIDKKKSDLTVRESDSVKLCQDLELYPPETCATAPNVAFCRK